MRAWSAFGVMTLARDRRTPRYTTCSKDMVAVRHEGAKSFPIDRRGALDEVTAVVGRSCRDLLQTNSSTVLVASTAPAGCERRGKTLGRAVCLLHSQCVICTSLHSSAFPTAFWPRFPPT